MQSFIKIPYSLIYNRAMGDKRVLAYSSIIFSRWAGDNIENLVQYSGFCARRDSGGVLQQYKVLTQELIENNYFKISNSGLMHITKDERYGIIYFSEFKLILHSREREVAGGGRRINHSHLLLLLAHIRLCMIRKHGLPQFYSNLLIRISESIGLSVRTISKCLKILEELNIIHSEELPRYKDNKGCWHSNVKIFVNMASHNWQAETSRGIRYILASQIE